jgi:Protein kinase domain
VEYGGKPIELGRGAMGITYKALDVDLRCPVALKVITERYLGDESARLRFLREARAAASVRHPNVASVFHLGRTGGNYFYAMEFVEGETLENLIERSGCLETKLAPQAIVVLLEVLLEKDPAQRFQNPAELLKAMPMIAGAIETRHKITRQSLRKIHRAASRAGILRAPAKRPPEKISLARLPHYRKRCFWPRRGYRPSGSCMGQQAGKCRYNRCLGRCRKVDSRQLLASAHGC